ncbi:unnamed protein product [Miscanthus lutarioriparius]|uniref:3-oxo-5-alpha-steroid 4-dehydrogenase C-terminal domain-containing protein n=1 Tax=Miscanthus lutarioriparius TaxID=422564 RepID=A0A811NHV2_9POAL|nr:unnamed protein product [Miscanthus lutarioriparius]
MAISEFRGDNMAYSKFWRGRGGQGQGTKQQQQQGSRALLPRVDLLYPGVLAFAAGLAGNFYHHLLLSRLRAGGGNDKKGYKIPTGGLFGLVTCPHYLFEILAFFGFAMISQTLYALTVAGGTAAYLAGRSCATRKWHASKFDEFPSRIKALVPYVW